jgi:Ca2+-binding EF-hand superfamily protein
MKKVQNTFRPTEQWNYRMNLNELEKLKVVFDVYDEDCDGVIALEHLPKLLYAGGIAVTKREIRKLWDDMDPLYRVTGKSEKQINLNDYFIIMARFYRDFEEKEVKIRSSLKILAKDARDAKTLEEVELAMDEEKELEVEDEGVPEDEVFDKIYGFLVGGTQESNATQQGPPEPKFDKKFSQSRSADERLKAKSDATSGNGSPRVTPRMTGRSMSTNTPRVYMTTERAADGEMVDVVHTVNSSRIRSEAGDSREDWKPDLDHLFTRSPSQASDFEKAPSDKGPPEVDDSEYVVPLSLLRTKLMTYTGGESTQDKDLDQALSADDAEEFINFLRATRVVETDEFGVPKQGPSGAFLMKSIVDSNTVHYLDLFDVLTVDVKFPAAEDIDAEQEARTKRAESY